MNDKVIKRLNENQDLCIAFNDAKKVRECLRQLAMKHNYKGELLNAYNKTFIFTNNALIDYILQTLNESHVLPTKYGLELLDMI